MKKFYLLSACMLSIAVMTFSQSQISLTGAPYNENFNSLSNSGTSSLLPLGWLFSESGTNADATYGSGTGSSNTGNTYSFGAASTTERAFGGLRSGSLIPTIGSSFVNNTGSTINSLAITYTGEQWRLGASGRTDRLDFQYSVDATSLSTGTWTNTDELDFSAPISAGTAGLLDGNATANRTTVSYTITGLSVPDGAIFYLRWLDVDATSSDDGLSIDDFTITTNPAIGITASITAAALVPAEPNDYTYFNLTLSSHAPAGGITINYTLTGTATPGSDYKTQHGFKFIAEGFTTDTFEIIVFDDIIVDPAETVIATITSGLGYSIGAPSSATVSITDNEIPPTTNISAIQGNGSNAIPGVYSIEAIVTSVYSAWSPAGFYVQEEDADADADPNTSNAIFVASAVSVAVGDRVSITGTVQENGSAPSFNQALIIPNSVSIVNSGNVLPLLTEISLPITATTDLEKFEGMMVSFSYELTVSNASDLGRFGEVRLSRNGPVYQATQLIDPNDDPASGTTFMGSSNVAAVTNYTNAIALRSIILDDGRNGIPVMLPFVNVDNTLRTGSTITNLTGILAYGFSNYRAFPLAAGHPYATPSFIHAARPALPNPGATANVKIASFNVLNYFNGNGAGGGFPTSRGANSLNEFNRQRDKIISALTQINADLVGLIELENDGTAAGSAIQDLVDGLNAVLGPNTYAFINDGANSQTFNTDEIRCALIYKPSVLTPVGSPMTSNNTVFDRPPLAHTFQLSNGQNFNYIINHFKSKSCGGATGANTDQGDGQSCYNDRRRQQALELINFINITVIPLSGTNRILSAGDYNAYYEEDPMDLFRANGYTVPGVATDYSYNFQGQLGALDHAIVSASLLPGLTGFGKWNINSAEPTFLSYEDGVQDAGESPSEVNPWSGLYTVSPWASSDHDAILMGFNITATLPVKLRSFSAKKENQFAGLTWITESEMNTKEFIIERSGDGKNFTSIGRVNANGNSSATLNYQWRDMSPGAGTNFYRLKMVDADGKNELSKVVKVYFGKEFYFSVSPNPAKTFINVYVENNEGGATLQLTDLNGKLVKQVIVPAGASQNIQINLSTQAKGLYLLKLITVNKLSTEKIIIE